MKYTIFSDTHLSKHVDQDQLQWLEYVISQAETIIINGDFWDAWLCSSQEFAQSDYQQLFAKLRQHAVVNILGNHDASTPDWLWSQWARKCQSEYRIQSGGKTFVISHGHLQSNAFDKKHPQIAHYLGWIYALFAKCENWKSPVTKEYRKYIQREHIVREEELINYSIHHKQPKVFHIFGHSHLPRFDTKAQYINPGRFGNGWARWLEIEDGKVKLCIFQTKKFLQRK